MDCGGQQRVQPVPRSHLRHLDSVHLQRAHRRVHAVADLFRVLERRRRDLHLAEGNLEQRPVQPGFSSGRRTGRRPLRVLGRCHSARLARLDLGREVDRRRGDLGQTRAGLDSARDRGARGYGVSREQFPGGRRGSERRSVRDLDHGNGPGRICGGVEQVDRRRRSLDGPAAGLRCGDANAHRLPGCAAFRGHTGRPLARRSG